MQILRTDWRGSGKWRKVAEGFNAIAALFNDMTGENGIEIAYHGGRLVIAQESAPGGGAGVNYKKFAFGYSLAIVEGATESNPSTTVCTIQPGAIRMHGAGVYKLAAAAEVTLDPMTAPWVYAQCNRGGGSITILASSTEPISNTSTLKIPLYQFERTTGGSYVLPDGGIHHIGDLNLDTPLF